nr:PREDICTED: protein FAM135B-like [Latimeria chalumnae]|eukprot:XP_014349371.1 PREDICTED: protein FAM135B-like [Latimeria chalumnae]
MTFWESRKLYDKHAEGGLNSPSICLHVPNTVTTSVQSNATKGRILNPGGSPSGSTIRRGSQLKQQGLVPLDPKGSFPPRNSDTPLLGEDVAAETQYSYHNLTAYESAAAESIRQNQSCLGSPRAKAEKVQWTGQSLEESTSGLNKGWSTEALSPSNHVQTQIQLKKEAVTEESGPTSGLTYIEVQPGDKDPYRGERVLVVSSASNISSAKGPLSGVKSAESMELSPSEQENNTLNLSTKAGAAHPFVGEWEECEDKEAAVLILPNTDEIPNGNPVIQETETEPKSIPEVPNTGENESFTTSSGVIKRSSSVISDSGIESEPSSVAWPDGRSRTLELPSDRDLLQQLVRRHTMHRNSLEGAQTESNTSLPSGIQASLTSISSLPYEEEERDMEISKLTKSISAPQISSPEELAEELGYSEPERPTENMQGNKEDFQACADLEETVMEAIVESEDSMGSLFTLQNSPAGVTSKEEDPEDFTVHSASRNKSHTVNLPLDNSCGDFSELYHEHYPDTETEAVAIAFKYPFGQKPQRLTPEVLNADANLETDTCATQVSRLGVSEESVSSRCNSFPNEQISASDNVPIFEDVPISAEDASASSYELPTPEDASVDYIATEIVEKGLGNEQVSFFQEIELCDKAVEGHDVSIRALEDYKMNHYVKECIESHSGFVKKACEFYPLVASGSSAGSSGSGLSFDSRKAVEVVNLSVSCTTTCLPFSSMLRDSPAMAGFSAKQATSPITRQPVGSFGTISPNSDSLEKEINERMLSFCYAKEELKKELKFEGCLYSDVHTLASDTPYFPPEEEEEYFEDGIHLVVCVHGLDGNSADLRLVKTFIELGLPGGRLDFLMSEKNQV